MIYKRAIPSNVKQIKDEKTGVLYSKKDLTTISSMVNPSASLIKFGEDIYKKYDGKPCMFMVYDYPKKGLGYLVYFINEDHIKVSDIYSDCINQSENFNCYEALIESVFNISKSMNKILICDIDCKQFDLFIKRVNEKNKEQKIEDKYWWKIQ